MGISLAISRMKEYRACGGLFVVISFQRFIHKNEPLFMIFSVFGGREKIVIKLL